MLSVAFTIHKELLVLIPSINIEMLLCDDCEATHGWAVHIGWIVFTATVAAEDGD